MILFSKAFCEVLYDEDHYLIIFHFKASIVPILTHF